MFGESCHCKRDQSISIYFYCWKVWLTILNLNLPTKSKGSVSFEIGSFQNDINHRDKLNQDMYCKLALNCAFDTGETKTDRFQAIHITAASRTNPPRKRFCRAYLPNHSIQSQMFERGTYDSTARFNYSRTILLLWLVRKMFM